jgi:hypothetical protein
MLRGRWLTFPALQPEGAVCSLTICPMQAGGWSKYEGLPADLSVLRVFLPTVYFYYRPAARVYRSGINNNHYLPLEFKFQTKIANTNHLQWHTAI